MDFSLQKEENGAWSVNAKEEGEEDVLVCMCPTERLAELVVDSLQGEDERYRISQEVKTASLPVDHDQPFTSFVRD